ncbi:MAG: DUF1232 domain-containing protein [Thermoanaerobaculia bacterium]
MTSDHTLPDDLADSTALAGPADTLPSTGLLSFYDRLRKRILAAVERRGGRLGSGAAEVLLLAPDIFILLARLALDRDVPKSTRTLVASTLAYFILPVDMLPEAMVGAAGYVDDLVLAASVLTRALGGELEPYAAKHWSGPQPLRKTLRDVLATARGLTGTDLYRRLKKRLAREGIDLDERARDA